MRNLRYLVLFPMAVLTFLPFTAGAAENRSLGELQEYTATKDDTFVKIARKFNVGFVELRAANPSVDPWLPGAGTELTIPTWDIIPEGPRDGVLINLPEMRVYVFLKDKEHPTTFPIAIGREGLETPFGTTTIVRKQKDPIWRPTPRMRSEDPNLPAEVGPGPENPMGGSCALFGLGGIRHARHEQALCDWPPGVLGLYPHVSGRYLKDVRYAARRHQGNNGERADQTGLG
ncbi:MAG: L,D-transpeptidase family protein [Alphaproteobacteria bacterium]|nr:L,D-transpeptidase family protein [Alphaproteobacteria bacterium]